jgi:hypothetical protein
MDRARAKLNFIGRTDSFLRGFTGVVILNMANNLLYPTSVSKVAELKDLYDEYTALLGDAANRNPAIIAQKNVAKLLVEGKLREICDLVNYVTPFDRAALLTTGFHLTPEFKINKMLQPFKKFFAENLLNKGDIKVVVVRGEGTQSVMFSYAVADALTDATVWTPCPGSGSYCILTNQVSGSKIYFKATAVGARKQVYVSEPISIYVL